MFSKIPPKYVENLTVRDLEDLIEFKKRNGELATLLRERDHLRLELKRIEDTIERFERDEIKQRDPDAAMARDVFAGSGIPSVMAANEESSGSSSPSSFLSGKKKKNLKDYIAQVLMEAREPLSPADIQRRLPEVGYMSNSTNPRSFYNTVFQALQRYEIFQKENKKYRLADNAFKGNQPVVEILPKNKTRLKDFIIKVLGDSESPLKVSEIASRVVIAGYETELGMDDLSQRVSATLKKYLNKDFDWDSQRYRLATRN
jgi:uncharacterized protein YdcH (DUF465 family)